MSEQEGDVRPAARIVYRNHRGEVATRLIRPRNVWFGATPWHPEPQWMLLAFDEAKGQYRDFALAGVVRWLSPGEEV